MLNKVRDVTFKDEHTTEVNIHTLRKDLVDPNKRHIVKGMIMSTRESYGFDDHPSSDIRFYDLFLIGDKDGDFTKPLTFAGDSGSLITDIDGNQIGIIVGGVLVNNQNFSFGIKLKDIFEILQLEPAKKDVQNNFFA